MFYFFSEQQKISTTRDDRDFKAVLIASRINDMWRKVLFHIDLRSSIFLHVKKYLIKISFFEWKEYKQAFFITEQQKDFYQKDNGDS